MQIVAERSMGFWRATSLVVGNIVGSGMLMLPAALGIYGSTGLLGWVLTAFGAICLALVFSNLSRRFPRMGGPYAYSKEAFGDFIGFQMAWCYWVGTWASNAALATAFVSYLSVFFPVLAENPLLAFIAGFSVVWLLTFVNMAGVKQASILQLILTILKIVPLVAIGIFGIQYINFDHFTPLNPSGQPFLTALGSAAALTLFSFLGIESATIPAENVINPKKTIPLATMVGTVLSAIIYIGLMIVIMGIIPPAELSKSTAPFAQAGQLIFGGWAGMAIAVVALISVFGTLNGWILLQAQVPLAAAADGLFPKLFGKVSKNGTPVIGLVISSALMTGMLFLNYEAGLVDQFTKIVIFATFAILLPYLYSAVADMYFILKSPERTYDFTFFKSMTVAILGFAYTIIIIMGAGQEAVFLGSIFVFSGIPLYVFIKKDSKILR